MSPRITGRIAFGLLVSLAIPVEASAASAATDSILAATVRPLEATTLALAGRTWRLRLDELVGNAEAAQHLGTAWRTPRSPHWMQARQALAARAERVMAGVMASGATEKALRNQLEQLLDEEEAVAAAEGE